MARATRVSGPPELRFWAKVDATGVCWEWTAAKQPNGYGRFSSGEGKKAVFAHRWAYEYLIGPISDGMVIDHLCRNRACVNPDHLEAVLQRLNVLRGGVPKVNGAHNRRKTHCPQGHQYDDANTRVDKLGRRSCLKCNRDRARERMRRTRSLMQKVA